MNYLYRCLDDLKLQQTQILNHIKDKHHLPKTVLNTWKNLANNVEKQIANIQSSIQTLINSDTTLKQHYKNLQTIPGISKTTASAILAEIPDISRFKNATCCFHWRYP